MRRSGGAARRGGRRRRQRRAPLVARQNRPPSSNPPSPQSSSHYTLSYGEFCARLASDPAFAARLAPLRADVAALAAGPRWGGSAPFPVSRWTRLLLLQQLLVEAMELLDPEGARVPLGRRQPLSACAFSPLVEHSASANYSKKLNTLEGALPVGADPLAGLKSAAGGGLAMLQSVGQK